MSHFSVMLVLDKQPTPTLLKKTLQPWHEYECTGTRDKYVVEVDVTKELKEKLRQKVEVVKQAGFPLRNRYDDVFYTKDTGKVNFLTKKPELGFELPPGADIIEITQRALLKIEGTSIKTWAKEYGNWYQKDERYFHRTNPNAKWDWWKVGGGYSGKLRVKPGASGEKGEPGLMGSQQDAARVDIAQVKDIDWAAMLLARQAERKEIWEGALLKHAEANLSFGLKDSCEKKMVEDLRAWQALLSAARKKHDTEKDGRPFYETIDSFPEDAYLRKAVSNLEHEGLDLETKATSLAAYCAEATALSTFAFIKAGKWHQQGDMGWWACVSNENISFDAELKACLKELRPTQWLAFVDCHI